MVAGNAVQWYLKRLDKNMTEDENMKPAAMMYYKASQTPVGSSTVKNMGSVVEAAAKLGGKAVKVEIITWPIIIGSFSSYLLLEGPR